MEKRDKRSDQRLGHLLGRLRVAVEFLGALVADLADQGPRDPLTSRLTGRAISVASRPWADRDLRARRPLGRTGRCPVRL